MNGKLALISGILLLSSGVLLADERESKQPVVVLDEMLWVTFYDLPSRRFRDIRAALIRSDHRAVSLDLAASANFISVEADRASVVLQAPLRGIVARLRSLADQPQTITFNDLDSLFGRAHWLLSQHYLEMAKHARDLRHNRNTSLYLWATTHHMERALLWSNVPVGREEQKTLEMLRDIAGRLQDADKFEQAYREKPVIRAEQLLRKLGKQIDRPVLLQAE